MNQLYIYKEKHNMYIKCVNKNKKHVCTHIFHKLFIFLMLLFIMLVFVVLSLGIPLCNVFVNSGKKGKKNKYNNHREKHIKTYFS